MVANTSHAYVPHARTIFVANSQPLLFSVVQYILDKVKSPVPLEPFIIVVLHCGVCLQNYIHSFKNGRIKRYIPKQSNGRGGLGQFGIDQKEHISIYTKKTLTLIPK